MKNCENAVQNFFEKSFVSVDLENLISSCGNNELAPMFSKYLKDKQPVLEAGCGSGQWMHFLKKQGIKSVGIDWSEDLKRLSDNYDPDVQFDIGDLRKLPYPAEYFGSVIALGSIEHVIEGPHGILKEIYRVMKNTGTAIITVPYNSPIRKITYPFLLKMGRMNFIRMIFNKPMIDKNDLIRLHEKSTEKISLWKQ